jgi:hypothetical protein
VAADNNAIKVAHPRPQHAHHLDQRRIVATTADAIGAAKTDFLLAHG